MSRILAVWRHRRRPSGHPRYSLLTCWVMKMIDSVTAVKVPVVKGIETSDRVEILRPQFSPNDKILLTGNYGLPDTAKVIIMKKEE